MSEKFSYKKAGVDIEKAEKSLSEVKPYITRTHNRRVLKTIGAFGGFYEFPIDEYEKPVLISSTDGVGTKLKVAIMVNKHDTIGKDLVHHCINDIAVCGATPLFFLDYFGCGKLTTEVYQDIIKGFTEACSDANLPLIGGETAEMPDIYQAGDYELVGTIVGAVEKDKIIDGREIKNGDVIIGVASNGLHTNGYSLARKVLFSKYKPDDYLPSIHNTLGEELLKIHINYFPIIQELRKQIHLKGLAHITGGGLFKNTIRIIPDRLLAKFDWSAWQVPEIFRIIQRTGDVPEADMRQTFNMGIGLVIVVDKNGVDQVLNLQKTYQTSFFKIGEIIKE